ncbi:MAG: hypothetical protein AAF141_10965, partial [Pseudomonadota bacterium]
MDGHTATPGSDASADSAGSRENEPVMSGTWTPLTQDSVETEIAGLPIVAKTVLRQLVATKYGSLRVTVPTGQKFLLSGESPGPDAELRLRNWGILTRTFRANSIGTAESYINREWESEDPA